MVAARGNVEQVAAWNGVDGAHWARYERHRNAAFRPYERRLQLAARIDAHEHVLDIGCGSGESTRNAARAARAGSAFGVDLSFRMIEQAPRRAREEDLGNARFEQSDAQVHPFAPHAFESAISRFGAVFFADPEAAFRNVGRGMRSGGRLVLLTWRDFRVNEWFVALRQPLAFGSAPPVSASEVPGPFGLADPRTVRGPLDAAGFDDIELQEVDEPVFFGRDVEDALGFVRGLAFVRHVLDDLDEPAEVRALRRLRKVLSSPATGGGIVFGPAARLISTRRSRSFRFA